jgi:hypothetical protein
MVQIEHDQGLEGWPPAERLERAQRNPPLDETPEQCVG